ncbi:MAG: polysaccharide biosynthesis C-terminal domain-containing protein [Myxococcota bacterium]
MSTDAHRRASRTAGVLVLGKVLATLAEMVLPLLIVRLLGKADVGALMALMLIYNTLAPIVSTGVPQAVMYNLPGRSPAERAAVTRHIVRLMIGLGGVAAVILAALGLWGTQAVEAFSPESGVTDLSPLLVLALFPLGDVPARMLTNLLVIEERPRGAAGYGLLRSLGMSVCTLVPIAMGGDAWSVATWLAVFGLAQLALVFGYVNRIYAGVARQPSPVDYGTLIRFGLPLGMTSMVAVLNKFFDRFAILLYFGGTQYPEYEMGAWQIPIITTIPYMIGTAIAPQMVEAFQAERPREALSLWRASIDKTSLLVVPFALVFVVAAEEAVELLFTADYLAAAPVLRWYSILSLGRVASYGEVIVAAGRPKYVLQAAVLSFASNVVLSVPLLFWLGFIGPAMGTALAFIPCAIFYCWCIARASGLRITETFPLLSYLRILAVGLTGVALAVGFKLSFDGSAAMMMATEAAILLVTFAVVGTLTRTIGTEDWRYLRNWLRLRLGG